MNMVILMQLLSVKAHSEILHSLELSSLLNTVAHVW